MTPEPASKCCKLNNHSTQRGLLCKRYPIVRSVFKAALSHLLSHTNQKAFSRVNTTLTVFRMIHRSSHTDQLRR
jgi:hypothetical protein